MDDGCLLPRSRDQGWIVMDELGMLDNMEAPFAAAALHHQCPSLLLVDCWQEDLKHANTGEGSRRYSCTHLTFGHPACGVSCGDFFFDFIFST